MVTFAYFLVMTFISTSRWGRIILIDINVNLRVRSHLPKLNPINLIPFCKFVCPYVPTLRRLDST